LNRRLPVNPLVIAALLVAAVAAGVVTSGFGLIGGDPEPAAEIAGPANGKGSNSPGGPRAGDPVEVAVLNATQVDDPLAPVSGVPGLADVVADELVAPAGFELGTRTNAPGGEEATVIMYEPDAEADAAELQAAVEQQLGDVEAVPITAKVGEVANGAPLVLLIGLDDAEFGQGAATATP
nr:LytR C-terminal domain-containing protein [Actinomycetota bacterium]